VFVGSFVLLNVYFAWDSRLLTAISPDLFSIVNAPIHWQIMALWKYFDLARFSPYAYIVADIENLALLIILVTSVAWLSRGRGFGAAVLRSMQVAALCLAIFGVELALLDCPEFSMHVTDFQESFNFLSWFSNADMLVASLAVLMASTLLLNRSRISIQWSRATVVGQEHHRIIADRRDLSRFLILFLLGILFVVGGWAVAYYGGVWRYAYSTTSSIPGNDDAYILNYVVTSYSGCLDQLRMASALAGGSSCSFDSFKPDGFAFVGLGAVSMVGGLLALKKRSTLVAEAVSRFWWVLALVVPLAGGAVGYFVARDSNRASGISMALLGVEMLLLLVLLQIGISLVGFNMTSACSLPVSPSYQP
jgi:hypothetical protein